MYLARFSYELLPVNRQQALDFIRREVEAATRKGKTARLLVPLTRGPGGSPALQFEIVLDSLDELDTFRQRGFGSQDDVQDWMHAFSDILTAPPSVELLRIDEGPAAAG
ncbi:MAG: hypothetical protein JO258_10010 [Alphaproteobacteria bacterium]|nr:hypothetical protein [Alphaproteobacteria bacterium]